MKAGIYARRSPRPTESETVARQLADARDLVASLGWEVVEEYVDNDISAYSMKRRPAYRKMLADLKSGRITAIVANHTNRLYRHPKDLVEFLELVRQTKADVRTVMSGHYDLNTAAGRKHAYQAGIDANYESDLLGERVRRERKARAAAGKPSAGGRRPFGYEPDKVTIRECEARLIRESAGRVAAGGAVYAEAIWWNEQGAVTTAGNPWEVSPLRRVLSSPRVAGLRVHQGVVVGPALWPAIIDRDTHDRLVAMLAGRVLTKPRSVSWLLSGLIACHKCGGPLYGSMRGGYRAYACAPGPRSGRGCGGSSVSADAVEAKVSAFIESELRANAPRIGARLSVPKSSDRDEAAAIEERRLAIASRWAGGQMTDAEYDAARAAFTVRLADLEAVPAPRPGVSLDDLLTAWRDGDNLDRRIVVEALVECPMVLSKERPRDPADRLTVTPRP